MGRDANNLKTDFWEYDPWIDFWNQKSDFKGIPRYGATGFSVSSKGYIGLGRDFSSSKSDFWEYDPSINDWTQKAEFGGGARANATGFNIGTKGYIGTGFDVNFNNDIWEYDPLTDVWTRKADFGGEGRYGATGYSIGDKGYLGFGQAADGIKNDWWQYTPSDILPLQLTSFTAQHSGNTNLLNWSSSQEINSSHFDIERSGNSTVFTKIGTENAKGGNNLQNIYSFTDLQPLKATNYYRLKITDNDGAFIYSNIKSVTNILSFEVNITPNPVATGVINLAINTENASAITIAITNIGGKVLYAQQLPCVSGNFTKTINVAAFAKGVYLLKAVSGNENKVIKFVKE